MARRHTHNVISGAYRCHKIETTVEPATLGSIKDMYSRPWLGAVRDRGVEPPDVNMLDSAGKVVERLFRPKTGIVRRQSDGTRALARRYGHAVLRRDRARSK